MTDSIGQEKVAYVAPSETTWCVAVRDGTGLSDGLFVVNRRNYYDTVEEAHERAQRLRENNTVDRIALNVVAKREIDQIDPEVKELVDTMEDAT